MRIVQVSIQAVHARFDQPTVTFGLARLWLQ